MKEKKLSLNITVCALAALLSAACVLEQQDDPPAETRAVVKIGDAAAARSLVPDAQPVFSKYELIGTAPGKDAVYRTIENSQDRNALTGGGYPVELEEASWTIEITAFVSGADGVFLKAARGTGSLTVHSGNPNPTVSIALSPLPMTMNSESKGILRWNLNLSGVTGNVTATGTITQVIDGIPDAGVYLPGISGSQELVSGYYLLRFTLYKDNKTAGVYRAAHIYPGLTTRAEGEDFTFTDADFAEQKYLAGTVAITGVPGGRAVEWVKVRPYQDSAFTMPLAEETDVTGGLWFLSVSGSDADVYFKVRMKLTDSADVYNLSGGAETGLPANGKKDIALSAVWNEIQYTVSYNAGNGSGTPPESQRVVSGATVYLPGKGNMTAPLGRNFVGWSIDGQVYAADGEFTVTGNTVCTARWGINGPLTPKPQPNTAPEILYTYADLSTNTGNTYLVRGGTIRDVYTSTISTYDYSGIPVNQNWVLATNASGSTSESVTRAVSESISVSVTAGLKASVEASVSGFGSSVKTAIEASMSVTESATRGYSRTDTVATTQGWSTTETLSIPFSTGDLTGRYRQAVYASVCDVYFYFKTSPDRQRLLSWNTIICARPGEGVFSRVEYSSDGVFACENPSTLIDFPAYFWRNFASPSNTPDIQKVVTLNENRSFEVNENNGHRHTEEQNVGLYIKALKDIGYRWVTINMDIDLHPYYKGAGREFWLDIDGRRVWGDPDSRPGTNLDWKGSWGKKSFSTTISIDNFQENNSSKCRLGFQQLTSYLFNNARWDVGTIRITFTAKKNL